MIPFANICSTVISFSLFHFAYVELCIHLILVLEGVYVMTPKNDLLVHVANPNVLERGFVIVVVLVHNICHVS